MSANIIPQSENFINTILQIRQAGIRSVNVEQDLRNPIIAEGYVLTAQSQACLGRILNRFNGLFPNRAWTLTGPYGSGKSYFSLFLMNLLCTSQSSHKHALRLLRNVDNDLANQAFRKGRLDETRGLWPVPISGYRSSFHECFKQGFLQAMHLLGNPPQLEAAKVDLESWSTQTESRAIIRWIQEVLRIVTADPFNYAGLLLVFDEMGKPLEFASSHPEEVDVYLLQELAEYANRSGETPFLFVGVLHQAFERYAALLDNTTQREWSKVQGRFEDVAFQEPPTQQMWLMSNAIEYRQPERVDQALITEIAQQVARADWRPPMMPADEFSELCSKTYPFHPTALMALPHLFRRLAQNERSIFAYLASHEPFGFQDFIQQHRLPEFIHLKDLFDYLAANFQSRLYASGRARVLTEALERLNNSIRLTPLEADVVKTIGLLNWLAEVSHLQANQQSLLSALRGPEWPDEQILQALQDLQRRSVIVHRRFNNTYSIWQGSDVDIEERLERARQQQTAAFSLAEAVQRYLPPSPVVARRHSYQKGVMRYFEVRYIDAQNRSQLSLTRNSGAAGLVLLCLPANFSDGEAFRSWAQEDLKDQPRLLVGVLERIGRLKDLLYELRCLYWVKEKTPELRDDSVARRELRTRVAAVEALIRNEIERTFRFHHLANGTGCQWFYNGQATAIRPGQSLSHLLSGLCDALYPNCPRLWKELVNHRTLSSQAAARRNLIETMLTQPQVKTLRIEGFPPERSKYESLFFASLNFRNTCLYLG